MLTINYNGKTYKITRYDGIITQLEEWIMSGGLEEVKENKEPTYIAVDPAIPNSVDAIKYACEFKPTTDPSILEKLREWVDKELKLDGYEHQQILDKIDLLASLDTPQFTPGQDMLEDVEEIDIKQGPTEPCTWNMSNEEATEAIRKSDEYNEKHFPGYKEFKENNQKESDALFWKPTPGEMIEVSSDFGKTFRPVEFVRMEDKGYICKENEKNYWFHEARPIEDKIDHDQVKENIRVMDEQDGVKIEPELPSVPDFKAHSGIDGDTYFPWELQIELLTIFCQALSRQKPTK